MTIRRQDEQQGERDWIARHTEPYPRDAATDEEPMRYPRTLRELDIDPRAWWASAEAEAANELHIREQFNNDGGEPRSWQWAHRAIYAIALCAVVAYVLGFFG